MHICIYITHLYIIDPLNAKLNRNIEEHIDSCVYSINNRFLYDIIEQEDMLESSAGPLESSPDQAS